MRARRLAFVVALLGFALTALWPQLGNSSIPSSVGLLYFPQKNFKPGDWVMYRVENRNAEGVKTTTYQRVQAAMEITFRSEPCLWLETGYGPAIDSLDYSAALVSENVYLDEQAEARSRFYLRKLHMETDPDGTPRASEVRTFDPRKPLPDMSDKVPTTRVLGTETLKTPRGPIECQKVEIKRVWQTAQELPDSTIQRRSESTATRWLNPKVVPITGLVREQEHKVQFIKSWPLGKPSKDFPERIVAIDDNVEDLIDYGHGAKPKLSDRMRDTNEPGRSVAP